MSYYMFEPGQVYAGCGSTAGGVDFNGGQVWADWVACDKAYRASQAAGTSFSGHPSCNRAVDSMRAALGQLGYGGLNMGTSWGSGDQAAYKQWASDAGVAASGGMPTETGLKVMETQIRAGVTPGPQEPIAYTKVPGTDTYIESSKVETATAEIGWSKWGLLALGAAGVVAVAVVAGKKKKGKKEPPRARPGLSGPPSAVAAR